MWAHKKAIAAVSAAVAVAGLAVGLFVVLRPGPSAGPAPALRPRLLSPFTGEPVASLGPVIAVKVDNIAAARPQTGLSQADIVYVLPVEGGLSRFLAVFSSRFPPVIGPVRSAREDDLELLRQFGRPAFAYSGAQPQLLPVVERARVVDRYSGGRCEHREHDPRADQSAPVTLPGLLARVAGTDGNGSQPRSSAGWTRP